MSTAVSESSVGPVQMAGASLIESSCGSKTMGRIRWGVMPNVRGGSSLAFAFQHSLSFPQAARWLLRQDAFFQKSIRNLQSFRVPAFPIAGSLVGRALVSEGNAGGSGGEEMGGQSETRPEKRGILREEVADAKRNVYKTCTECRRSKLLCDFKATKGTEDKQTDICRACLAKLFAVRTGRELYHLDMSVEEAWERAKVCCNCGLKKELRDFARDSDRKDFLRSRCRSCDAARALANRRLHEPMTNKLCARCHQLKPGQEFPWQYNSTGLSYMCKKCTKEYQRERRKTIKEIGVVRRGVAKVCIVCKVLKPTGQFSDYVDGLDGLRPYCKKCDVESYRLRRKAARIRLEEGFDEEYSRGRSQVG